MDSEVTRLYDADLHHKFKKNTWVHNRKEIFCTNEQKILLQKKSCALSVKRRKANEKI